MRILFLLLITLALASCASRETKPNVVLINIDDLGWRDTVPWMRCVEIHLPLVEFEGVDTSWVDDFHRDAFCRHDHPSNVVIDYRLRSPIAGYSPRGKTPAVRLPAKRERINLISSVTNQGKVRFMVYDGTMNANTLIRFLKRIIKGANRKIFLILDNLRVHHALVVKKWLEDYREKLELFFLPSYSPELNPDEYLNCDLKAGVHSGVPARTKGELKKKAISHLRMLQKKPGRVTKYYKHPKIAYAA